MKKISQMVTANQRRIFLEQELAISLRDTGKVLVDQEKQTHCENVIGAISLPLGVAGPIAIKNLESRIKNYYIPLATTEGALVASVNRGCKAITQSGGVIVAVETIGATRGPVFQTAGIIESLRLKTWFDENFEAIAQKTKATSHHLKLKKIETYIVGDRVFVRLYFDTQDAMGMNMVTIATVALAELVEEKTLARCIAVAGNFDIDKKAAWLNNITGRGKRIWAEAVIPSTIVSEILKTSAEKIYKVWLSKCMIGSAISGSLGFNAHFANIVAAFFAATGQDLAHVVEGSLGITTTNVLSNHSLYISVYLPDVMIGTVGGGTGLKTQKEAINITGAKKSIELAKVMGGGVLAGELSLLSSLAQGSLASAHKKLGR